MKFVFVRHGKPEDRTKGMSTSDDDARELTEVGREDARRAGEFLRKNRIVPNLVVTTKRTRTIQTADIVMETVGAECPRLQMSSGFSQSAEKAQISAKLQEWVHAAGFRPNVLLFVGHDKQQHALRRIGGPEIPRSNRGAVLVYEVGDDESWTVGPCFLGG